MEGSDQHSDSNDRSRQTATESWLSVSTPVFAGLLTIAVFLFFGVLAVLSGAGGGMMGGGMMGGMGGGMVGIPWLWLPLFIPPIIGFAVLLYTFQQRDHSSSTPTEPATTADPAAILETRYLDDEIGLAEYETRLGQLFDTDAVGETHPQLTRLAIQYARGEIDREGLDARIDRIESADASLGPVTAETVVESAAEIDRSDIDDASHPASEQPTATQRLRRRYADGELSHDEYEQRLETLRETATEGG